MFTVNQMLYEQLAELLVDSINGRGYFSGIIEFQDDDMEYRFSATLMIYYSKIIYPEGDLMQIKNLTPVWWEFHSTAEQGEVLNDFDFNLLKESICR